MHMHWKYPCLNSLNSGLACFNKRTEIHPCMLAKAINKGGKVSANLSRNSKIKSVQRKMMKKTVAFQKMYFITCPEKINIRSKAKQNKPEAHVGNGRQSMIPCGMISNFSAGISG